MTARGAATTPLLAALLLAGGMGAGCGEPRPPPNVLLYVVDTLRADALPAYGNRVVAGEHTSVLAREGTLFERAYAPSSWTRASVGTILTGLPPAVHGAVRRRDALAAGATLLSERFSRAGYATAAVVGNPNVGRSHGFDRGWDAFVEGFAEASLPDASSLHAEATAWLARAPRPFFLFVLAVDPHEPYAPPPDFDRHAPAPGGGRFAENRALYLGEVEYADHALGQLLAALRRGGELDDTIVAVTADHGEEFGEHGGRGHGRTVYEEVLRVPLLLRYPPRVASGARVREPVALADLAPTLLALALAGKGDDAALPGRDLLRGPRAPDREIVSHIRIDRAAASALIEGPWKLVVDHGARRARLFDLADDPGEARDLATDPAQRERVLRMVRRLAEVRRALARAALPTSQVSDRALPEATRRSLEALGYLTPATEAP